MLSAESPTRTTNLPGSTFQAWDANIPIGQRTAIERKIDVAAFTGIQHEAFKPLQFPLRPRHGGGGITDVNLRHFRPGAVGPYW